MSGQDFLPRKDADFLQWAVNFLAALAKIVARIGFPDTVYNQLVALKNTFSEKFNIAEAPETRTGPATRDKNVARKSLEKSLRQAIREYLTNNHLLTDTDRESLGLPVYKTGRTPAPVAKFAPDVEVDTSVMSCGGQKGKRKGQTVMCSVVPLGEGSAFAEQKLCQKPHFVIASEAKQSIDHC